MGVGKPLAVHKKSHQNRASRERQLVLLWHVPERNLIRRGRDEKTSRDDGHNAPKTTGPHV
jgi:hypothetical protein